MSQDIQSVPRLSALATTISGILGTSSILGAGLVSEQAQAQQSDALDEILITGSRIVRRDFTAASPIVTIEAERLEQSSTLSIESVLNQMPQFTPSGTQFVSGGQGTSTATLGIASANLRGIGTNRTLVLFDGRRAQPSNAALVVDFNTVPSAAIARIETITGGASAVYGPDALAGVVNIVLKRDFEGADIDFHTMTTAESDARENRFSVLLGANSGDGRGNVMVGLEWYDREAAYQRDRKFYQNGWWDPESNAGGFLFAPGFSFGAGAPRPSQAAVDAMFAAAHPTYVPGSVNVVAGTPGAINEIYFNPDGTPFTLQGCRFYNGPLNTMTLDGQGYSGQRINRNGNCNTQFTGGFASTPQQKQSIFGRATYDLADNLSAFAQVTYSNNAVTTTGGIPPAITVWQALVPNDGRNLPPGLQDLLDSRPNPGADWAIFRGHDWFGEPFTTDNKNNVFQLVFGLDGRLTNSDMTWDLHISKGQTDTRNDYRSLPSLQRYNMLVRAPNFAQDFRQVIGRNYELECGTGLPMFGGPVDDRCLESMSYRGRASSNLTQDVVEFNIQGPIADMRGGELRFAAGAAYRDNSFEFMPLNDDVNVTDHPIGLFVSNDTSGRVSVEEVYGELLVPVTQRLNLEFGYRYSEFSTESDAVGTWKALFDYGVTNGMRLRGGLQSATRAPNTAELFQGPTMLTVGFGPSDPCSFTTSAPWGNRADNPRRLEVQQLCHALIGNDNTPFGTPGSTAADNFARPGNPFFPLENEIQRGNPDLNAEKADTWTLGAVFQSPGGLENLTASIDYYNIEIEDAISPISSLFVYQQCFNADGQSNPTLSINDPGGYCALIERQPFTGERDQVQAPYFNQGALTTAGIDLAVNWLRPFSSGASFYMNSMVSILREFKTQDSAGEPFIDFKGTAGEGGQYDYRLNATFGYNFAGGNAGVGLRWFHLPSIRSATAARSPNTLIRDTVSYDRFGLFANYRFNDRMSLRGGIDNLFDKQPPLTNDQSLLAAPNRNASTTNTQYYDILGRRAYVGLKMSF
jgi:iron complex outermembrane recepter protein